MTAQAPPEVLPGQMALLPEVEELAGMAGARMAEAQAIADGTVEFLRADNIAGAAKLLRCDEAGALAGVLFAMRSTRTEADRLARFIAAQEASEDRDDEAPACGHSACRQHWIETGCGACSAAQEEHPCPE